MKLTGEQLNNINNATFRTNERAEFLVKAVHAFENEGASERQLRLSKNLCGYCYFLRGPRIAGQAFWDWKCRVCGKPDTHPNTGVPCFCADCAKEHGLCVECGGSVHMKRKRASR